MLQSSVSLLYRTAIITFLYCLTGWVFYLLVVTDNNSQSGFFGLRLGIFLVLSPIIIKFLIQIVSAPLYPLFSHYRQRNGCSDERPTVSVLIPAWNEQVGILKTIQSVLNTQYEKLEVIVINDGSTDNTHQLVERFVEKFNARQMAKNPRQDSSRISLRYLQLANGGKAKALNSGLQMATGEFIITIDADCIMDREAIQQLILHFDNPNVGAVAGNIIVGNRKKPIEVMQQLEYLYGFFFKRADSNFNAVHVIGGAAAAYRKSVLEKLGGFDETIITEDVEMSIRILGQGFQTRYASNAVIYTEGPSDWQGLFRQRLRWKYGRLLTFIKHKELFFSCKSNHNPYLTCLLLPLALYAEFILLFEGVLLSIFYGYTFYTQDYLPLALMIGFITSLVSLQIIFDRKSVFHLNLLVLAPVAWIIFYVIDAVELQALYRSLKRLIKRENLEWQRWVRVGLLNKALAKSTEVLDSD